MSVKADLRNIATIERLCKEITRQCAYYRRNSEHGDDTVRFLIVEGMSRKLLATAAAGTRRYQSKLLSPREPRPLSAKANHALMAVQANPGIRRIELARLLEIEPSNADALLATLMHRGLVRDEEIPDPARPDYPLRLWYPVEAAS